MRQPVELSLPPPSLQGGPSLKNGAAICPGFSAPGLSGGLGPIVYTHIYLPVFHKISETKVSLCQVLQTLPKITAGITQIDEG